jgi:aminoglycoside phosphotransferase family enzyme/predicted kinase
VAFGARVACGRPPGAARGRERVIIGLRAGEPPRHGAPASGIRMTLSGTTFSIDALRTARAFPHPADDLQVLETHISWVVLAGAYAYKIRKPVDLGFVDFRGLDARRHDCDEEIRLNRRTAPALYLDVVPIVAADGGLVVDGAGEPLEYAVRMRRFAQDDRLDRLLAAGRLDDTLLDALADEVAAFHARCPVAGPDSPWGTPEAIAAPARENVAQIAALLDDAGSRARLDAYARWLDDAHARLAPVFARRRREGFVREAHGDLHLGNLACIDGRVTLFDCLEFSPALRWIDVINEIAFLVMDLDDRGHPQGGARMLNRWLERTGDYAGIAVLRYYLAYRAMVRAKVALIRRAQRPAGDARASRDDALGAEADGYLRLAARHTGRGSPAIVLMHGLSGSGKSAVSQALLQALGAIRLRSDVERKRLHGLDARARSASGVGTDLYAADASRRTYAHLCALAGTIVAAGYPVLVDATCLMRWQRALFVELAARSGAPLAIVDCQAPEAVLRARLAARAAAGADPSEADAAVLDHQLATREPLDAAEQAVTLAWDATQPLPAAFAPHRWDALATRLGLEGVAT